MARKLAAVAFTLGCLHASSLMALGLGEMQLESFLNEPLKASVDLLNMGSLHEDEIKVRLATTEDFDKLGLERAYFLTNITFEVVQNTQDGAQILIRSEEPVLEPYLDFIVEARWPSGRLLREYTVLVDPPVFSNATPVVSASERVAATDGIPAPGQNNEQYSSGATRVDLQDSNLASGAMPQRDYNASTQGSPTPGGRYMIHRDQTLWEIASQAKPSGATVHQTMLDIQRLNPDAFINGNINRIKAGYIIYLPSAADISSADVSAALAQVREQNAAWREGRDDALSAHGGPSLRISAEPEESVAVETNTQSPAGSGAQRVDEAQQGDSSPVAASAGNASADTLERLAALEEQLATLQRIVSLKDDQIAALQSALKEAGGAIADAVAAEATPEEEEVAPEIAAAPADVEVDEIAVEESVAGSSAEEEQTVEAAPEKETEAAEPASAKLPAPSTTEEGEGWTSYLLLLLGALVLAVAGFMYVRQRGAEEDTPERPDAPDEDVFADVRLQDQDLEVDSVVEEPSAVPETVDTRVLTPRDNRGYGERKHDEYASDVDAADALAEADIYIAYGRHPQAIDLLNNALNAEPGNPVYRLKLLEIYAELNNRVAATAQLKKIVATGEPDSIARAEKLMEGLSVEEEPELAAESENTPAPAPAYRGPGLSPNPLEILTDSSDALEDDFSDLEIEEHGDITDENDLDLSSDFTIGTPDDYEDEDLVIAADSNALSTKLDLARAYLDMGDDDGARQILDEVVAEGTEDLKAEARALLDRIG